MAIWAHIFAQYVAISYSTSDMVQVSEWECVSDSMARMIVRTLLPRADSWASFRRKEVYAHSQSHGAQKGAHFLTAASSVLK